MAPLEITIDVKDIDDLIAAARVEAQRKFAISDTEWEGHHRPFIEKNFGHALSLLLTSDAITNAIKTILEGSVRGLEVTGLGVTSTDVLEH